MHFRRTYRKLIAEALQPWENGEVHSNDSVALDDSSFVEGDEDEINTRSHVIVSTPRMEPVTGLAVIDGDPRIGVALGIDIAVIVKRQGECEDLLDELERRVWMLYTRLQLPNSLELQFDGEQTTPSPPEIAVPTMARVLRFSITGEFDPFDPISLTGTI